MNVLLFGHGLQAQEGSGGVATCTQPASSSNDATVTCTGSAIGDTCSYVCDDGFTDSGDGTITCTDNGGGTAEFTTPTCADGCTGSCTTANSVCTGNDMDGFNCQCDDGYTGTPDTACTDFDECDGDPTICGSSGTCSNTDGSYTCACDEGYEGGGDATPCTGGAIGMNNSGFFVLLPAFLMVLSAIFLC